MVTETRRKTRNRKAQAIERSESTVELIDFKMVTFTLAGNGYGIDIMKVKEIAKFMSFTYVPNTPTFVRGVYNLRGEIISIIDLRKMFNLLFDTDEDSNEENGLILRLDANLIGIVVDKIDKVIGISKSSIQPPHPIFGNINIKYISGVVENESRLYIILDVERILGGVENVKEPETRNSEPALDTLSTTNVVATEAKTEKSNAVKPPVEVALVNNKSVANKEDKDQINKQFIRETLEAYEGFYVGPINSSWFDSRFEEWKKDRKESSIQLENKEDARLFLSTYTSAQQPSRLWDMELVEALSDNLPNTVDSQLHIWNPGCAKGYETYSLAVLLKRKYPNAQLKIWASDKDLLSISSAPNLIFKKDEVPNFYLEYMVESPNGWSFNQEIKDAILFEYHDVGHTHSMPPIQLMVARDLFSYLSPESIRNLLSQLDERIKPGGIIILGSNEKIPEDYGWEAVEASGIAYFKKKIDG